MKYNVGDKVIVKSSITSLIDYGDYEGIDASKVIYHLAGKQATISKIVGNYYCLLEDWIGYHWDESALEDVEEEYDTNEISVLYG